MKNVSLFLAAILFSAYSVAKVPTTLPKGLYGGKGINVAVIGNKVTVELGCSHGEFSTPSLDQEGSFTAEGWMETDLMMQNKPKVPTEFTGNLNGANLSLQLVNANGKEGSYSLTKGKVQPPLMKCK